MAVFQFSALSDGQAISFNPTADVLRFDQTTIAAADLRAGAEGTGTRVSVVSGAQAGKDVLLQNTSPLQLSVTNVTFADGSRLLFGDGLSAQNDDAAHSLTGTVGRDLIAGFGGNDTLNGGDGADVFVMASGAAGSYGADSINGGLGLDVLDFTGVALSAVTVNLSAGTLSGGGAGGAGSATLAGIDGAIGGDFNDTLIGRGSADLLAGGAGNDSLSGGAGNDQYLFAEAPGAANADLVSGFTTAADRLVLDRAAFAALGAGDFAAGDGRFRSGAGLTSGQDADDRIVYNTTTGQLFYDADGNGAGAAQLFATLSGAPTLAATDIDVIGEAAPPPPPSSGTIQGTEGDDSLVGTEGPDSISGLGGNDSIDGLSGDDTLDGGPGFDMLSFQSAGSAVVVDLGAGSATGGAGTDVLAGFEELVGTDFDDRLTASDTAFDQGFGGVFGGNGNDTLTGGAANDFLSGDGTAATLEGDGNGNDEIHAGSGNDSMSMNFRIAGGSYGNDIIDGGAGLDEIQFNGMNPVTPVTVNLATGVMTGGGVNGTGRATLISIENVFNLGNQNDVIIGTAGANRLDGGDGYDTIQGGDGNDVIGMFAVSHNSAAPGRAELRGEAGNDVVGRRFGSGEASMSGGTGNDTLSGGAGVSPDRFLFLEAPGSANADVISGFEIGVDWIELDRTAHVNLGAAGRFAAGDARFFAGAGATSGQDASDRVIYNTTTGQLFYDADGNGAGAAQVIATLEGAPSLEAQHIFATGSAPGTVQGTSGNDALTGTTGDDVLQGLAGNDTLTGLAGNDTLDAGTGADRLVGGTGNDSYIVDGAGDAVVESAGEGTDTVFSSATRTLDANVENLTLTGTAAINGTSNSLNNVITGNSANNVLTAGAGGDTLIGGAGNDTYVVDGALDRVVENPGEGIDTLRTSVTRTLEANVENLTLIGGGAIGGTGNALSNLISGNGAANTLAGGDGNDRLEGRGGNDSLTGGTGADLFVFLDAPSAGGVDRVQDFVRGTDELLFENAVFSGLGTAGAMAAGDGRFRSGSGVTSGQDSTDRLVYNTATGQLFYDADGSGAGGSTLIATFAGNPALTATDFTVI